MIGLLHDIMKYVHEISSVKELSFKSIEGSSKTEQSLHERYDKCVKESGKTLCRLFCER